jgi:hypothetical protein
MICAEEAQQDIAEALGVRTSQPVTPNWSDHVYSCRYVYPTGVMVLSVKELADDPAAVTYYAGLSNQPGQVTLQDLGDAAFANQDGSVVTRKDRMVLTVDVHAMPATFGQPTKSRGFAAYNVAQVIMGCWVGDH